MKETDTLIQVRRLQSAANHQLDFKEVRRDAMLTCEIAQPVESLIRSVGDAEETEHDEDRLRKQCPQRLVVPVRLFEYRWRLPFSGKRHQSSRTHVEPLVAGRKGRSENDGIDDVREDIDTRSVDHDDER